MRRLAKPQQPLGNDRRRKVGREVDDRLAPDVRNSSGRGREVGAELGIEGVRPLEQEGEGSLRSVRPQAAFEERRGMEADRVGGGENALGGRLAHPLAGIEHAIDGRDAHMRRAREIGDGGAAAQRATAKRDRIPSLGRGRMMDSDRK
ncbi:MAG TPA: hypothetical protein VJY34_05385 [Roseiarcus sp.]|nr:hypothetical protein [Roseiarcus sp.]